MLNCDEELENAVKEDNYEKVRALLPRGVNPNHKFKRINKAVLSNDTILDYETLFEIINSIDITRKLLLEDAEIETSRYAKALRVEDTLLHWTHSLEITRELLLYGADVNSLNKYRVSPLHSAITNCKKIELVRELLKHGADVNARSLSGHTPLHYALEKKIKNMDVVKLLLQYGADFYLTEEAFSEGFVDSMDTGKVLISFIVIKHFERDDVRRRHPTSGNFGMWLFQQLCIHEVYRLKRYMLTNSLSLYEFLIIQNLYIPSAQARTKLNEKVILTHHTIYQDMILDKLKSCIKRSNLIDKLRKLEFCTRSKKTSHNQDDEETKNILNFDATYSIVKYICNDDLENLIVAFDKGTTPLDFSDNGEFLQQDKTFD